MEKLWILKKKFIENLFLKKNQKNKNLDHIDQKTSMSRI
jgi:hypothetical protein